MQEQITVGLAQITPVWLNREATLTKVVDYVSQAADKGCQLVAFGEALAPGYPFWLERTNGAEFNSPVQKELHALYLKEAVVVEEHLGDLQKLAQQKQIAVYLGGIERAPDRGGHSVYCSLVYINARGEIGSVHRKLMPTYEERLAWSPGDGHGLRVHPIGAFTVGGLNCWENWMPLPRAALYAQGEDVHVAVWPGSQRNTQDITRFIAQEARSYVISVSGLMRNLDIPDGVPQAERIRENSEDFLTDGGSCVAAPDGKWLLEPQVGEEGLYTAMLDYQKVREERQNFDPSGHYSRPDVTQLTVNRERQSVLKIKDS
ncbi:MAG: carbon-nitrogen hydrolase family protein [Bacteroidota bacterium]